MQLNVYLLSHYIVKTKLSNKTIVFSHFYFLTDYAKYKYNATIISKTIQITYKYGLLYGILLLTLTVFFFLSKMLDLKNTFLKSNIT